MIFLQKRLLSLSFAGLGCALLASCALENEMHAYNTSPACVQKKQVCKEYQRVLKMNKGRETDYVLSMREQCNDYTVSCSDIVEDAGKSVSDRIEEASGSRR